MLSVRHMGQSVITDPNFMRITDQSLIFLQFRRNLLQTVLSVKKQIVSSVLTDRLKFLSKKIFYTKGPLFYFILTIKNPNYTNAVFI